MPIHHSTIRVPLTLEQVAVALSQLSPNELEQVDQLLRRVTRATQGEVLRPAYVRKIKRRMKELAPHRFTTPEAFLAQLHGK